jgi:hypothetical protein
MLAIGMVLTAIQPASAGMADADPCTQVEVINDSCPVWAATYGNHSATPSSQADQEVTAMTTSQDGSRIFTAGISAPSEGGQATGIAVIAYDAATGTALWTTRHDVPGRVARPQDLALSPDGATLFVAGTLKAARGDMLVLGLSTADGTKTFQWQWDGAHATANGWRLAVAPGRVFVAGSSASAAGTDWDYAVAAFDLEENEQLWAQRYDGPASGADVLNDMIASADGSTLFVTGESRALGGVPGNTDAATLALRSDTGAIKWTNRSDGNSLGSEEAGKALALSPDGTSLFVMGNADQLPTNPSGAYAVLSVDTATGSMHWYNQYASAFASANVPEAITVDDRGERVFVTGTSEGTVDFDATTIAFDATTGTQAWEARYGAPGHDDEKGSAVAYDPDSDRVFVTGTSGTTNPNQARIFSASYDAGNGHQTWSARYSLRTDDAARLSDLDTGTAVALDEGARKLFVAGTLGRRTALGAGTFNYDFGTMAYNLPGGGRGTPNAGGWASQNLEYVGHVPNSTDTAGMKILGDWAYVTTESALKIYDITDPVNPKLTGVLANAGDDLPYFPEEDVDTNGKILLMGADVIDVTDKANPRSIATLNALNDHTSTCVLDCTWAYTSSGRIIDLRTPTAPAQRGLWTTGMPATGNRHDVTEVSPGMIVTSSNPFLLLDAREDPAAPKLVARGPSESGQYNHGNLWPNQATDKYLLMGGEASGPNCAGNASSVLRTFDVVDWADTGEIQQVDKYTVPKGLYTNGQSPEDTYCAHWVSTHPAYRNGGLLTMGWYEHGVRLLRVNPAGKIREVGFFIPHGGTTSAAYWVSDSIIYVADYTRGFEIIRYTGRA